jgi:hypothetical protein
VALQRRRLGEILIEAGVLTEQQLSRALAIQKEDGRRLGAILLSYGIVAEPQLVQALSRQLSVPWVSLWHVDVPEDLLDLVPLELAKECCAVPVYVRSDREQGVSLYVAMDDPTNEDAIARISAASGMSVKAMVAGPSDIASAIKDFYGPFEPDAGRPEATTLQMRVPTPEPPPPPRPAEQRAAPAPKSVVHEEIPTLMEVVTLEEAHIVEGGPEPAAPAQAVEVLVSAPRRRKRGARDTIDEALDDATVSDGPAPAREPIESGEILTLGPSHVVDDDGPGFVSAPGSAEEIASAVEEFEEAAEHPDAETGGLVEEGPPAEASPASPRPTEPDRAEPKTEPEGAHPAEAHRSPEDHARAKARARALAMTLLDGTTIALKGRERNRITSVPELVSLLRASANGEAHAKPLPSTRWEHYVAAIIELLVSKRVLDEQELLDRLTR